jgi:hypothetical protein
VELRVETGGIAGVSKSARELGRERFLCPELGSESEESLLDESESSPEDDNAEEADDDEGERGGRAGRWGGLKSVYKLL